MKLPPQAGHSPSQNGSNWVSSAETGNHGPPRAGSIISGGGTLACGCGFAFESTIAFGAWSGTEEPPSDASDSGFPRGGILAGCSGTTFTESVGRQPLCRAITPYSRNSISIRCMSCGSPAMHRRARRVAAVRTPSAPTHGTRGRTTWDTSCGGLDPVISSYSSAPNATISESCSSCREDGPTGTRSGPPLVCGGISPCLSRKAAATPLA